MIIDYDADADKWLVTGTARDIDRMNTIPGSRARRKTEVGKAQWRVVGTLGAAKQMKTSLPDAKWTDEAKSHRSHLVGGRKARLSAINGDRDQISDKLAKGQSDGVWFLWEGSGLLADDMGSGKTVQVSYALGGMECANTVLVLTTKSTLVHWARHLKEWAGIEPFVFHGPKRSTVYEEFLSYEGPKALISTHALARTHSSKAAFYHVAAEGQPGEFNEPFDVGIIDEIHKMGVDPKKPGVRALHQIGQNCAIRWGLTGTPINDNPDDFWIAMNFVEPDLFIDRSAFRKRYCVMRDNGYTMENLGLKLDMQEEFEWLVRPYMLRRDKREIRPDLPDALPPQILLLPLTAAQKTLYNKLVKDGIANTPSGQTIIEPDTLGLTKMCEYIACAVPVINDETGLVTGFDPRASSNKLEYILETAEQRNGDPFLVYSYSAKVVDFFADALKSKGYKVGTITGARSTKQRDAYVEAFQDGQLDVLLFTDAGAEGLTLTSANLIIFAWESWRALTNQQARDRIDRWGQQRETQMVVLLSEGTIDESRRASVNGKVDMQQQVLQDKNHLKDFLTGTWVPDDHKEF